MLETSTIAQVKEFHEKFGHLIAELPSIPPDAERELREALLDEELRELKEAFAAGDIVAVYDALCDLQYVLDGAFLICGMHSIKSVGCTEVHSSNMSKLGADGKPVFREDGKILKGPNYRPPNLAQFIEQLYSNQQ